MRLLQHGIILTYLSVTAAAFFVTTTHRMTPLWPWVRFHYGMMAPFQGYLVMNHAFGIQAQDAMGTWHDIDDRMYFPFLKGERSVRMYLQSFQAIGPAVQQAQYDRLAEKIFTYERRHGRDVLAIRLTRDEWPVHEEGYEHLRTAPFLQRTNLSTYP